MVACRGHHRTLSLANTNKFFITDQMSVADSLWELQPENGDSTQTGNERQTYSFKQRRQIYWQVNESALWLQSIINAGGPLNVLSAVKKCDQSFCSDYLLNKLNGSESLIAFGDEHNDITDMPLAGHRTPHENASSVLLP